MTKPARIDRLKQKKEEIEKQLAELETRERNKTRKEDNRLKVLIGAALLADAKIRPELAADIQKILDRAITAKRDRVFLQEKGWLPSQPEVGNREERMGSS
jgi:large subunit ribosomal protein L7/L12